MSVAEKILSVNANLACLVKLAAASGRNYKNFFETRVIEYQTGGALSWD
jgi:hypothetical protein